MVQVQVSHIGWIRIVDSNGEIVNRFHFRSPFSIDTPEDAAHTFDESVDRIEDVVFDEDSSNLINDVLLVGGNSVSSGIETVYGAADPQFFQIPNVYRPDQGEDTIKVEYNSETDITKEPVWTNLRVTVDEGQTFAEAGTPILWDENEHRLRLRSDISFQLIPQSIRITGTILTGQAVEATDEDSISTYGRRQTTINDQSVIGFDRIRLRVLGMLHNNSIESFKLQFNSEKKVNVGDVIRVRLPSFARLGSFTRFLVTQVVSRPRTPEDRVNRVNEITLGKLANNISLGG